MKNAKNKAIEQKKDPAKKMGLKRSLVKGKGGAMTMLGR
jgi:hypothetical protein